MALGTATRAFAKVRIRVERMPMFSIVPSTSGVCIQSPTSKGLSENITREPKRFAAVSLAARAKARPPKPKDAKNPVKC